MLDRLGVVAPDIDLRLLGILRDDPLVLGQHRIDPGRRRAAIGQLLNEPGEQAEPALHAAEAPGLQDAQYAGLVVLGDRLAKRSAQSLGHAWVRRQDEGSTRVTVHSLRMREIALSENNRANHRGAR
ncbi:MAG TPA: hypothetical protein VJX94_16140 [Stellaceae bacterium]|nr:hypothetical protein [Stellaceae bacterium]